MIISSHCSRLIIALGLILALSSQAQALIFPEKINETIIPNKDLYDVKEPVTVILEFENKAKGLTSYGLELHTGLEARTWTASLDGDTRLSKDEDWSLNVSKDVEKIAITLVGSTPDWGYVFEVPFIAIRQQGEKDYVYYLARMVASGEGRKVAHSISAAKLKIKSAQDKISQAEDQGLDVSQAKRNLEMAQRSIEEAELIAKKGDLEQALIKAQDAEYIARRAYDLAEASLTGAAFAQHILTWVPICVALILVILVLYFRFRRWERL